MKKSLKTNVAMAVFGAALASSANAAAVQFQNYSSLGDFILAIADSSGAPIASMVGFIAVGSFSMDDAAIMGATADLASFQALVADFNQFGESVTFGGPRAFNYDGFYNGYAAAPIGEGDPLLGRNIYTVATSSSSLASAVDIFVYKHNVTFAADTPLFFAEGDISAPDGGTILLGTGGLTINIDAVGGAVPGARAAPVVPEASAISLIGFVAMMMLVRRKR